VTQPGHAVSRVDAIVLAGGSAFGLDAAAGAMRFLREQGRGFPTPFARVPIVPAAILYDLGVGAADAFPTAEMAYAACASARSGERPASGRAGAGMGATVGKLFGLDRAAEGGVGHASVVAEDGLVVGALAAVNSLGSIYDPESGALVAGPDVRALLAASAAAAPSAGDLRTGTTLAVVAVGARLGREALLRVALMASAALARAIVPAFTPFDGDIVFAVAAGGEGAAAALAVDELRAGLFARQALEAAVLDAVGR